MKILCVTGSINQGGSEYQILALANLLNKSGHDVQVLALTNYTHYLAYIEEHCIKYRFIDNQGSKTIRLFKALKVIILSKPEIVIAYARIASSVAILGRIFSFLKYKLIISERTSLILPRYDFFYFRLSIISNAIVVNSIPKSTYIIKSFPFLKDRVFFVPNLIDFEKFSRVARTSSYNGITRLSYIGRISPEKNLLRLIRAVNILANRGHNIHLNLYGGTNNQLYFKEIKELISILKLDDIVEYKGMLYEITSAYYETDIICLVSTHEGFSNVLAEAMICGIPMIASDIPENRYLIEDSRNGYLVIPESEESIAYGIEKYINLTYEEKEKIFKENKVKAKEVLDPSVISLRYLELIKNQ